MYCGYIECSAEVWAHDRSYLAHDSCKFRREQDELFWVMPQIVYTFKQLQKSHEKLEYKSKEKM